VKRFDMTGLARLFPSLDRADGIEPFDSALLAHWLETSPEVTGGGRHAARFILSVWNSNNPFEITKAMNVWDEAHRRAFLEWAKDPWGM
jgi:hypothetical protein